MGLFKKIGELISDEPSKDINAGTSETKTQNQINALEIRNELKSSILNLSDTIYLANPDASKGKNIILWTNDSITYDLLGGFDRELLTYLSVERGYGFASVDIRNGKPADESACRVVKIGEFSVFVELKKKEKRIGKVQKAKISVFEGNGKLLADSYELSSEYLLNNDVKFYNIGRGENPRVDGGGIRHNHIVVDENECTDYNKFVSRAHAHIGYSETIGFYLQVEFGGSRISGSRTRIFRGTEKIEVDNMLAKEPLQDSDLIELGKSVLLIYNEEN